MDESWREVASGEEVVDALGLTGVGVPLLERLLLAPGSGEYLWVEADEASSTLGFDIRVPGTRFYFNVSACRKIKGDIGVALTAFLVTHSVPVAAVAAALRKLGESLDLLSEDEVAAVRAVVRACPGNPYEVPVSEEEVRARFRGDPDALDDLLDALQAKGVIEGRRHDRVKLVY